MLSLARDVISNYNAWNGECEIEILFLHSSGGTEEYCETPQSVSPVSWRSLDPGTSQILSKKSAHFTAMLGGQ